MHRILWLLAALPLTSCLVAYEKPVCNSSNLVDVPNMEGYYRLSIPSIGTENSHITNLEYAVSREARGTYRIESTGKPSKLFLCELEGQIYAESPAEGLGKTGYTLSLLERSQNGSFSMTLMGSDTDVLKARGVPYQIIEALDNQDKPFGEKSKRNVVMINNNDLATSDLLQVMDPLSLLLVYRPIAR